MAFADLAMGNECALVSPWLLGFAMRLGIILDDALFEMVVSSSSEALTSSCSECMCWGSESDPLTCSSVQADLHVSIFLVATSSLVDLCYLLFPSDMHQQDCERMYFQEACTFCHACVAYRKLLKPNQARGVALVLLSKLLQTRAKQS